ncbi:MAG: NifB/NifX family molybdenum-iron cluster-binding protein [Pirellulales bacterium]|nr:NifB/NifX family molybdenum-iron cluster-binding protein [Pirellulales bacterium]
MSSLPMKQNATPLTKQDATPPTKQDATLVVAVPVAGGRLCAHFGHCEQFAIIDIDKAKGEILNTRHLEPPPHEPGALPRWLHEQGVKVILAGGMGRRAQMIFAECGIDVVVGAPSDPPEQVVLSYVSGTLEPGDNLCDH